MKVWKKLSAVALALVMVMALSVPAFADSNDPAVIPTNDGTVDAAGAFTSSGKDSSVAVQNKTLKIPKDITAFNADSLTVAAPTITYTYTIAAGSANKTVTDDATDHTVNTAVTKSTIAGVTTNVVMTSDTNSTSTGTNTTLEWTTNEELTTSSNGTANTKYVYINFSNVAFGETGVYRYEISETVDDASTGSVTETYAMSGVTDGGNNKLYLDVYVKPNASGTFTVGSPAAADWDIYGYALFADDSTAQTEPEPVTSNTPKVTGFVGGDKYYTFNLTVSKDIVNDAAMITAAHQFPFSVAFTNSDVTQNVLIKETVTGPATSTSPSAGALTHTINNDFGVALKIGDNSTTDGTHGSVKYIGIPVGTQVVVTEKNDVTGATYGASTKTQGTDNSDAAAIATGGTHAVTLTAPTANTNDMISHTIEFTNTLMNISPTGVTLRYAPYMAMMGLGIVALPLSLRKKEELD